MQRLFMGASALVLASVVASQAFAQAAATPDGANVDAVVVTGTRTTGLRAVDSAAPVQVLGNDILKRVAQPDLVQSLAQNIPSLQAQNTGTDQAQFNKSFKLRGVSPNHTLVLVDGERRHGTSNIAVLFGTFGGAAAADINFIPVSAIDHVEVLQDGAAAQYGTDAIAGVINIILKKSASGGSVSVDSGQYYDGGGLVGDIEGNMGFKPNDKSFLNITGQYKYNGNTFRGNFNPQVVNLATTVIPGFPAGSFSPATNQSQNYLGKYPQLVNGDNYPYAAKGYGEPLVRLGALFYNGGYEINDNLSLFSFGSAGTKDARAYEGYRTPDRVLFPNGTPMFPAGFDPFENDREIDYSFTGGLKGTVADTTWKLSTTYGDNRAKIYVLGSANADLLKDTGATPTTFYDGAFEASEWTTDLDLTHQLDLHMATPLTLAGGAEYRRNTYSISPGDPSSYYASGHSAAGGGAQSFFGYGPQNSGNYNRSNYAFYADVALSPIKPLTLDGAVRYENYSDFGSATIFKGTGRFDFNDAIAIRATADTGFRAPSLGEEYYSGINVGPTSISPQLPANLAGPTLGVGALKPEKSTDFSVGFVTHFVPRLTMTLDAYALKITNRIMPVGGSSFFAYNINAAGVDSGNALLKAALVASHIVVPTFVSNPALGTTATATVTTFANAADTQTYGVDYVATYPVDMGKWGHMDYSLAMNYNSTAVTKIVPPPAGLPALLGQIAVSTLEDSTPKWRANFGAYWSKGPWGFNFREEYYGATYVYANPAGQTTVFIQEITNAAFLSSFELSYEFPQRVKLSMGANNAFNVYPNKVPSVLLLSYLNTNSASYATQYVPSPYGYNGGQYYGRLTWSF